MLPCCLLHATQEEKKRQFKKLQVGATQTYSKNLLMPLNQKHHILLRLCFKELTLGCSRMGRQHKQERNENLAFSSKSFVLHKCVSPAQPFWANRSVGI